MNTVEISEMFNVEHRNVYRIVSELKKSLMFPESSIQDESYTTAQNKVHKCYSISDDVVRYILSSRRMFRATADRVQACSSILERMKTPHKIVIGDATRQETKFGILMDEFFGDHLEIIQQYHIGDYFVDFYIPSCNIVIEYDERHHNTKTQKEKDKKREVEVSRLLSEKEDDKNFKVKWVRVDEGFEVLGLRKVMGAILELGYENQLNYFIK
ncbi:MAG: DUF559 domain-containing protein [Pseudomonadota bacterium]